MVFINTKFSEACTAGTYRDSKLNSCTKCPENSVTEQDGGASCTSCTAGTVSNEERTKCGKVVHPYYIL